MANIYVGFHDNRSSSRVLKPPGGGTSNIFGTDKVPDVVPKNDVTENNDSNKDIVEPHSPKPNSDENQPEPPKNEGDQNKTEIQNGNAITPDVTQTAAVTENGKQNGEHKIEQTTVVEEIKIENLKIEENTTVVNGDKSESVVDSSVENSDAKASSIGDILRQNAEAEIAEKKKTPSRQNRVPPGGYSSGLW